MGLAVAYLMLSFALALAWFSVHLSSPRGVWQSGIVLLAVLVSLGLTATLGWASRYGWRRGGACVGSRRRRRVSACS
jgi:hypothetical protein